MSKLSTQLKRVLRENGCYFVRPAKGSHEMWYSPINDTKFTVPHGTKSKHTANEVLKQAGIVKQF